MHRTVIGWVICIGRHCRRAKIFYLNFLVQESREMRPREIFMQRTVIGWVICVGRHCRRAKIFYLSQPGIEPRSLDLQANTLPRRCIKPASTASR